MSKLNILIPDRTDTISRLSLLNIADFIGWLQDHNPDVLQEAMKAMGKKEMRIAFNDLEKHVEDWR